MTTFIKTKFKISDLESPSNFQVKEEEKLFKSVHKKEIGLLWSRESFGETTISDLESPSNFQVKEKKLLKLVKKPRNYALIKNAKIVMFKMNVRTSWYGL